MDEAHSPRALDPDERALLDYLLSLDRAGFEALREQALHAEVITSSIHLIEFQVPRTTPSASGLPSSPVSRATSRSTDRWADAFLWISKDGYLDSIEIMWPDGEQDHLPRPADLTEPIPA